MKSDLVFLSVLILMLGSCKDDVNKLNLVEENFISSLRKSDDAISNLSNANYLYLHDRLKNITYGERVELWNEKALKLKAFTITLINETEVLNRGRNFTIDTIQHLKNKYINEVKLLDTSISKIFKRDIELFLIVPSINLSLSFIIEKTRNDILLFEVNLSSYFNYKAGAIIEDFTTFSTLIGQSATHLKSGDLLDITAGIGSYTTAADPTFIINGNFVKSDENARATYKIKVAGRGRKTIPVKIYFTSNRGTKESKEITIDYYVDE